MPLEFSRGIFYLEKIGHKKRTTCLLQNMVVLQLTKNPKKLIN